MYHCPGFDGDGFKKKENRCEPAAYCSGLPGKKVVKLAQLHVISLSVKGFAYALSSLLLYTICFVSFRDRVLLCRLGWPGPHHVATPGCSRTHDPPEPSQN